MSRIKNLHIQDSLKFNYYLLGVCFRANTRQRQAWGPPSSPASSSPPCGAWSASSSPSWCLGARTRASSRYSRVNIISHHDTNIACHQVTLMLTAACCWLFWLCCYMSQMNPLIGPVLETKALFAMKREWDGFEE